MGWGRMDAGGGWEDAMVSHARRSSGHSLVCRSAATSSWPAWAPGARWGAVPGQSPRHGPFGMHALEGARSESLRDSSERSSSGGFGALRGSREGGPERRLRTGHACVWRLAAGVWCSVSVVSVPAPVVGTGDGSRGSDSGVGVRLQRPFTLRRSDQRPHVPVWRREMYRGIASRQVDSRTNSERASRNRGEKRHLRAVKKSSPPDVEISARVCCGQLGARRMRATRLHGASTPCIGAPRRRRGAARSAVTRCGADRG